MKKIVLIGLVLLFSLSACVPDFLNSDLPDAPTESVDLAATVDIVAKTQVAQTFAVLNTPTMEEATAEPPAEEVPATATETILPSETPTLEATETASVTPDGTLLAETATETPDGTLIATATGTLEATATSIYPSPTSPISVGDPPPSVPRYKIKIINHTKYRAYISLQGVTVGDYHPIIEYDFYPWERTKFPIPEGRYTAVVYIGKDPLVAYFGIHSSNTITIIIKEDKIEIEK